MKILRTILMATLVLVSLTNAAQILWSSYHRPLLEHHALWRREVSVLHTREVLNGLGVSRIGYVAGPFLDFSDFENQFLLTPVILRRNSPDESFVLVYFRDNDPPVPPPGLTLVEDFHNGFALFRRIP
jgi:hypothetical protein